MLKLYNTLTKKVEEIVKPEGRDHINMYSCGPTVYNYAHIGNLRSFIMADLLYRTLKFDGYKPHWVMNITDIDDKTIKGTLAEFGPKAAVADLHTFTEKYLQIFRADLKEVNVLVDEIEMIRVTDKMKEIQEFIVGLMDKGYGYKADDGVYFSIEKYQKDFGDYGSLVGEKFIEGKKVGARVAVDEYEKDNLSDFALWKAHNEQTDGQIFWDHPVLGKGRPGWHIECSVINQVAFKGESTDIHTGGVDLIFPHHTNEIAQSQALLGKGNFVKHWFHSEHLLVDGKKMAKSAGNFFTLKDIKNIRENAASVFRKLLLNAKYNTQQDFKKEDFLNEIINFESLIWYYKEVLKKIDSEDSDDSIIDSKAILNDLNFPQFVGKINKLKDDSQISWNNKYSKIVNSFEFCGLSIRSLLEKSETISDKANSLLGLRQKAKDQKDFAKSDELRKQIEDLGYEVMDTPDGQKVKKKINI